MTAAKNKSFASDIANVTNPALQYMSYQQENNMQQEQPVSDVPKKRGRKPVTREKKTHKTTVSFYPSLWAKLEAHTQKTGESINSYINRTLIELMNEAENS